MDIVSAKLKHSETIMTNLQLKDVMTANVVCVQPDTSLQNIFQTLAKNNYSCCVVASDNRIPLGILTERDLIRIISEQGLTAELMSAAVPEHMYSPPFTLPADTSLDEVLNLQENRNVKHLLATNIAGEIVGIVTLSDVVKAYNHVVKQQTKNLEKTVIQRTQDLERVNKKLTTLSMRDALTGLSNRRAMEVDITRVHAASIRHGRPYSVILFDIDYFKKYNDHYGHQSGDTILKLVADHFRNGVRESDAVYRFGGEEFLLIMPETDLDEAMIPVQRIVESLYNSKTLHIKSPLEYISTSAGIACSIHEGEKITAWRKVVELADIALYKAKNAGRNQALTAQSSKLNAAS